MERCNRPAWRSHTVSGFRVCVDHARVNDPDYDLHPNTIGPCDVPIETREEFFARMRERKVKVFSDARVTVRGAVQDLRGCERIHRLRPDDTWTLARAARLRVILMDAYRRRNLPESDSRA